MLGKMLSINENPTIGKILLLFILLSQKKKALVCGSYKFSKCVLAPIQPIDPNHFINFRPVTSSWLTVHAPPWGLSL